MLINRDIFNSVWEEVSGEPKIIIIYGPRQSGKTTLINHILSKVKIPYTYLNGDDLRVQELLGVADIDKLRKTVGDNKLLVIDEAQRIPNIGITLKLIFDHFKIHIITSGSSSFDLANKINEPLTGRSSTYSLYPISYSELPVHLPDISNSGKIEEFLRFGMYPKILSLSSQQSKENYLYDYINNYLYYDIMAFENVRKPKKIIDLLSLIALQMGSEVSIIELSRHLSLSKLIIDKYLDILEKMFVIINVRGFSRNLRKEISKTSKYYFIDLGLRNALIRNFNPINFRTDAGAMFENFAIVERMKKYLNKKQYANFYFWRTYDQKEIDLIEERSGKIKAFEFKWKTKDIFWKPSTEFLNNYKNSQFYLVNPSNFDQYLKI